MAPRWFTPTVLFRKTREKRAADTGEEPQAIPFLKRFTVFNLAQCEACPMSYHRRVDAGAGADRAEGRGADQGNGHRLPHWR